VKPSYLETLRKYLRAVKQRNVLLKDQASEQVLRPWHEEVARLGEIVSEDRIHYLNLLIPHFTAVLAELAPSLAVDVLYRRGWGREEQLSKLLAESSPREVKYASTLWGPHRADVQIRADGLPAGNVLSRGQGKLVASALQIGQASLLSESEQRTTVFLIDDAGAELDMAHNARFFTLLEQLGGQILATTTREPSDQQLEGRSKSGVFHVKHGEVTPTR
jgi:DNA replication and repair protein RecF